MLPTFLYISAYVPVLPTLDRYLVVKVGNLWYSQSSCTNLPFDPQYLKIYYHCWKHCRSCIVLPQTNVGQGCSEASGEGWNEESKWFLNDAVFYFLFLQTQAKV